MLLFHLEPTGTTTNEWTYSTLADLQLQKDCSDEGEYSHYLIYLSADSFEKNI